MARSYAASVHGTPFDRLAARRDEAEKKIVRKTPIGEQSVSDALRALLNDLAVQPSSSAGVHATRKPVKRARAGMRLLRDAVGERL